MSYFARLASQSQLDIAGQRPADGPRSAEPVGPGAPDLVEIATSIEVPDETASAPVRPAPEVPAPSHGPRADADRGAMRAADERHASGLAAGPGPGRLPEATGESPTRGLAAPASDDSAATRAAALLAVREVIDWIAAGVPAAPGAAAPRGAGWSRADERHGIAPELRTPDPGESSIDAPVRREGVLETLRHSSDEPRDEPVPRHPAPVHAAAGSVDQRSVSEAAKPGEPPRQAREASVQPRVEEVIEVSIGTISVRVEAPPPEAVVAPREPATSPVREAASEARRPERVARLGRHYL